ncbi:MAG: hypothetical protein ACUVXA_03135 [Candidatus Jordarchaeum sp.]|uniref:hypothetical protein n=1 Tax=Candidatus Jordarchaeum sp. TaxID=2823881 RepID=UPI0040495438
MKKKKVENIFKLGNITNISSPLVENLKIAPYVTLNVERISKSTDLHFKVELSFKKKIFQKVEHVQNISSDGKYLIPLPLEIKNIPSEANKVGLRVELRIGRKIIAEKKASLSVLHIKNMLKLSNPYIRGRQVKAGERRDYFCDLKNLSKNPITLYFELLLLPLGGDEIKIFGEPLTLSPGRLQQIQARINIPVDIQGDFFIVAHVKSKQEEQALEQCSVLKTTVRVLSKPVIIIRITESPQIPISINGGEKVNFNLKILQNVEKTDLKVDVLAVGENSVKKLKTFQIRQQKGEQRMYGVVKWDTPKVSGKTYYYIDFNVYKGKELLSDRMVEKEKKKITLIPTGP